jgi:drug/metabolite transporter (DMT)-like permease
MEKRPLLLAFSLLMINVFWGGSFIANVIALRSIGPIEIASLRFFIAAPVLAICTYLWKGKELFHIDRKDWGTIIIMALTGVTLQYIVQVSAQDYTTATNASLLINTSVFFIFIFSAIFLAEKMTMWRIVGAILGFAGVGLLVTDGSLSFDLGGHSLGDMMIILSALMWAIYSIYGKDISKKYHPLTILNYVFILGTIGFIPFYFLTPHLPLTSIPLPAIAAVVFLAVFCSIIAYLVYNIALEKMDASKVAVYVYFVPLSTIILAAIVLGEAITPSSLSGGIMVLAGMYIAQKE